MASGQIIYSCYYHVGVAVDTERACRAVIRDVMQEHPGVGSELAEIADARQKLSADDRRRHLHDHHPAVSAARRLR